MGFIRSEIKRWGAVAIALCLAIVMVPVVGFVMLVKRASDGTVSLEDQEAISQTSWAGVWPVLRNIPYLKVEKK